MKLSVSKNQQGRVFPTVAQILEELERDLPVVDTEKKEEKAPSGKEVILEVLARAADDYKFLARLANDPSEALKEYAHYLTWEQRAALACGDRPKIESWVGELDKRLRTWCKCRSEQEKW
ncbi:hypothetical protein ACFLTV_01225 [Chloroflexota bacterium]